MTGADVGIFRHGTGVRTDKGTGLCRQAAHRAAGNINSKAVSSGPPSCLLEMSPINQPGIAMNTLIVLVRNLFRPDSQLAGTEASESLPDIGYEAAWPAPQHSAHSA